MCFGLSCGMGGDESYNYFVREPIRNPKGILIILKSVLTIIWKKTLVIFSVSKH